MCRDSDGSDDVSYRTPRLVVQANQWGDMGFGVIADLPLHPSMDKYCAEKGIGISQVTFQAMERTLHRTSTADEPGQEDMSIIRATPVTDDVAEPCEQG